MNNIGNIGSMYYIHLPRKCVVIENYYLIIKTNLTILMKNNKGLNTLNHARIIIYCLNKIFSKRIFVST